MKRIKYILPSIVTLVLYCIILAIKGIYPFGVNTIDYYDMAQQIAAFYYHVYDMLHGTKAFYYDFYTALGVNMAMSTSGCSNLSLFNLLFLLIKRDFMLEFLSIFHGIKLMCMSFTMYYYLHKTHRAPYLFELIASVGYAFCGFVLVLYITNQWVDIAVMFPLIMYFYDRMLKTGKIKGYVITLSLTLIASYYLGFMILIFIFLYTGLNSVAELIFTKKSDRRPMYIAELGIGTVLSLVLSAFTIIPQLTQMLSSARFKNGSESEGILGQYIDILKHVEGDYTTRWWTLLGISLAAAVIMIGIIKDIRNKKDKRDTFMSVSLILMMVLELFFESINLIWHFGSYVQYPIRNGFIINFVFGYLMCLYAGKLWAKDANEESGAVTKLPMSAKLAMAVSAVVAVAGVVAFVVFFRANPGMPLRKVFHITSAVMAVCFLIYVVILSVKKDYVKYAVAGLVAMELLCYGFLLYGQPDFITGYSEEPEQNGEYIRICNQLKEEFSITRDNLARVKNPDESLNANYGLALERPALSNWTHMIAPNEQSSAARWGYSIQFTRLLDSGGTVFSDALLGVKDVISCVEQDPALYDKKASAEIEVNHLNGERTEYSLYEPKYTLPFGILISVEGSDNEEADMVELHNQIYDGMLRYLDEDSEDDVIAEWYVKDNAVADDEAVRVETSNNGSIQTVTADMTVSGTKAVYLNGSGGDMEYANCTIEVTDANGTRLVNVPTISDADNAYYPAHFNNNTIYIGCYTDEAVTISVHMDTDKGDTFPVCIAGIDIDNLAMVCDAYNSNKDYAISASGKKLDFSIDNNSIDDDVYMLLPLTHDAGWSIKNNGRSESSSSCYAGLFTAIPMLEGRNNVSMSFMPVGMMPGIILSVITAVMAAIYCYRSVNDSRTVKKINVFLAGVNKWLTPVYTVVAGLIAIFMYAVPIIYGTIVRLFG